MKLEDRKYILNALVKNAKTTAADLAEQLGVSEQEVAAEIADLEKQNIIRGYHALVNEDNLHEKPVKAIIEVRVRPEREGGFDRIARRLSNFPQVTALYLMSGGYDLMLEVRGADLNEVASFVSSKLATIDMDSISSFVEKLKSVDVEAIKDIMGKFENLVNKFPILFK